METEVTASEQRRADLFGWSVAFALGFRGRGDLASGGLRWS